MPACTRCQGNRILRSDEMECAERDYSPCDACGGSGQREDQLRTYISKNQERHMRDSQAETAEWIAELVKIAERKPMLPILLQQ